MDQLNLTSWIDRTETVRGVLTESMAGMVQATIGAAGAQPPGDGDVMPPLWHWYAFPPMAGMQDLGSDGHPRLGGFLPPVRLERRMWAGGKLAFHAPLHVGEALTRQSRITGIEEKTGAAGDMVFVTVTHEVHGAQGLAITETQNIVYLAIPDSYRAPKAIAPPVTPDVTETQRVTEPLLFRYSAITFNAHRIHYDLPYTRDVEHYPALVVHGPLQANLLIALAQRHHGRAPDGFAFRGVHPMFCPDNMALMIEKTDANRWSLCTATGTHQGMQATVTWKETTQ